MTNATSALLMTWPILFSILLPNIANTEYGSEAFDEFLAVLGEKITLKGWERFRGGLDVKGKIDLATHINNSNAPELQLIAVIRVTFDSDIIRRKLIAVINPFQFCHPFR